jgi:sugar-specific transcriptional regulator TrmB
LSVSLNDVENLLKSRLKLSNEESKTFILIVKNGRTTIRKISESLNCPKQEASRVAKSLVDKGMIIDVSETEYESLHPRFAISNRYRRLCIEDNIPFKKNLIIDNIGIVLERPFEAARAN